MKRIDDIDIYFKTFLNNNFPELIVFDKYKFPFGDVLHAVDEVIFRTACLDYLDSLIKDGSVIYKNGEYYEI